MIGGSHENGPAGVSSGAGGVYTSETTVRAAQIGVNFLHSSGTAPL